MSLLQRIASATLPLEASLEAPLAAVPAVQALVRHLQTTNVHPYVPFARFGALHALRVGLAWAQMTKGRGEVGVLADLLGFLVVAWGGGTLNSLIASQPPFWLLSPTPWGLYVAGYVALIPTGLASFISSTAPALPLALFTAVLDGLLRGVAITLVPALTAGFVSPDARYGWFAPVLLSAVATCGGGWIVQAFGLHKAHWALGRPGVLDGGLLNTLDVWGAALTALLYLALTGGYPSLAPLSSALASGLPADLKAGEKGSGIVSHDTARAIAVVFFTTLFAARALTSAAVSWRNSLASTAGAELKRDVDEKADAEKPSAVLKAGAEPDLSVSAPKQRKRKHKKAKSPTP
ncbi:uncharacterized protein LOC62_05G007260 [Vanrija pseudolonga]|uniref:Uncharacterized protein n=1 Tax=Vanrija pseudolonga TaxID=143232 RepID=A0AAF0YBP3_9TREE|nr:hypothetical protein LOC62_05G007260 [Vanrija pseudolonga]